MRWDGLEAVMLYVAALFFLLAAGMIGADYAGVRAAHSAGVTGTLFLMLAIALVMLKEYRVRHGH
jgi:positive regulator of sigma E activity